MAGIEKVCEICREYDPDMYWVKHNSIQVCPECRKKFKQLKNKHSTVYFWSERLVPHPFLKGFYTDGSILRSTPVHYEFFLSCDFGIFWNYTGDFKATRYHLKKLLGWPKHGNLVFERVSSHEELFKKYKEAKGLK